MPRCSLNKSIRQCQLRKYLDKDPFLTDKDLSQIFGVSVQTIRLDRFDMQIPELRERVKNVARGGGQQLRTMAGEELVGDLVDLDIGNSGISILPITPAMTLSKTSVARGHHIFAQANSLAVAVIDAGVALTGAARVSFKRPVYCGEKILAKAVIKIKRGNKYMVRVTSQVKDEIVFKGKFLVFALQEEGVSQ